jgi:hypothetical protein
MLLPLLMQTGMFGAGPGPGPVIDPPAPANPAGSDEEGIRKKRKRRRVIVDGRMHVIDSQDQLNALLLAKARGMVSPEEVPILEAAIKSPEGARMLAQYLQSRIYMPMYPTPLVDGSMRFEDIPEFSRRDIWRKYGLQSEDEGNILSLLP